MRLLFAVLASLTTMAASAQMPPIEQINADLTGQYQTSAAQPLLSERGHIARRLEPLMLQQAKYLVSTLHPWEADKEALLLTDGNSGEHGIRPNARTVHGLATMVRMMDSGYPDVFTSATCRNTALKMLRFILPTHGAGGQKCGNGKQWKDQWQSALWAYSAGKGAWLLWDDLTPEMKWLAARMICDEADRFVGKEPPAQVERDTKAEENAWNSLVISLAYNMFPKHPHHAQWRDTAIRWAITSFCREADMTDTSIVDGRPLKDWMTGPNIHDDYTLENHDRVHPDYMSTIHLLLDQKPMYEWGGNPVPAALTRGVSQVHNVLKKMSMPDGGVIYPNGQDWQIHRNPIWFTNHMQQAILFNDPAAARLMLLSLETIEKMAARNRDGGVYLPDEFFFPSTQTDMLVYLADSYIYLCAYGDGPKPMDEQELWKSLEGIHVFDTGKFVVCRKPKSVSTFSWGRQVMGMAVPLTKELLVTPNERSLIGQIEVEGVKSEHPVVQDVKVDHTSDTFTLACVLERAGGAMEQRVAYAVLADGTTFYADKWTSNRDVTLKSARLGLIGILNEPTWVYGDGKRIIHTSKNTFTFKAGDESTAPVNIAGVWYNVDDTLGIVPSMSKGGAAQYTPLDKWSRGRIEQLLSLSDVPPEHSAKLNKRPEFAISFFLCPGADSQETQRLRNATSNSPAVEVDFEQLKVSLK